MTEFPRVLVDASNLRVGGGVQVAVSFLEELVAIRADPWGMQRFPWLLAVQVEASPTVVKNLSPAALRTLKPNVVDRKPLALRFWAPRPRWRSYDVSLQVFGPEYGLPRADRRIVGYADVTSIFPRPPGLPVLPLKRRVRNFLRAAVSRVSASTADVLIVETTAMADRLVRKTRVTRDRVRVVSNCCHQIFDSPEAWGQPFDESLRGDADWLLAYVTRAYPHKNLDFLGEVAAQALRRHGVTLNFLVTLDDDEWMSRTQKFRDAAVNVGPLPISLVPRAYEIADAAVFPSLLEAFSAMPLEAFKLRKVLFASDRDFVWGACGDAPLYFDPMSATDAASVIVETLSDERLCRRQVELGSQVVSDLPSARDRAIAYLEIIEAEFPERTAMR